MVHLGATAMHVREALGAVQVVAVEASPARRVLVALDARHREPCPLMRAFDVRVDILVADVAGHKRKAFLRGARATDSRGHLVVADHAVRDRVLRVLLPIAFGVERRETAVAEDVVALVADRLRSVGQAVDARDKVFSALVRQHSRDVDVTAAEERRLGPNYPPRARVRPVRFTARRLDVLDEDLLRQGDYDATRKVLARRALKSNGRRQPPLRRELGPVDLKAYAVLNPAEETSDHRLDPRGLTGHVDVGALRQGLDVGLGPPGLEDMLVDQLEHTCTLAVGILVLGHVFEKCGVYHVERQCKLHVAQVLLALRLVLGEHDLEVAHSHLAPEHVRRLLEKLDEARHEHAVGVGGCVLLVCRSGAAACVV
mmetsp:Transcript_35357/g.94743  ORF Transcript_35357/g.94743 Transcript_35357/m.94743 type:complete len:370 (+) Transcript_35357:1472-2581(+)